VIADEFVAAELHRAQQMLQGFSLAPPFDQSAQGCETLLIQHLIEAQIELKPTALKNMSEEMLHV
jgi:hypothetical protein